MAAAPDPSHPLVVSLCGTWLKPEMQSLYRQVAGLTRWRTVVLTEKLRPDAAAQFPLAGGGVEEMIHRGRTKPSGHFIKRWYYKYFRKQWPPPRKIIKRRAPYHPYDLPERLARLRPQLVHVYYGHKAVKYRRMLKAAGVPWIVSFHGVDVVKGFDRPHYDRKMLESLSEARLVLARSESLLTRLERLGVPRAKLRLNRTPVPLDGIEVRVPEPPVDGRWVLFQACRLIAKKGLFTTVEALKTVCARYPQLQFRIGGTGPQEEKLRRAIAEAGLEDNILLLGWLDQAGMRAEFARAHAFLHPSELTGTEDQEGVPNSMLEAMAHGLPVIGTLHGGIPEALVDGGDGLLVPEKSPAELAAAILRIIEEPGLLQRLGAAAAASVRAKYGAPASLAALEACYDEAIGRA